MELKYTDEKAVLLLIATLKVNNIHRIIVSPGSANFTFVGSLQHDDFFELYSCVDERSAAYMACGMAAESGEPVVITCTGATAPRNYFPGLTEAYYRKLPILAVCCRREVSKIGHLYDQQVDERNVPADIANTQIWLPIVKDNEDEVYCRNELNKAIIALQSHGGGPVFLNLCSNRSQNMTIQELPKVGKMEYYTMRDPFPVMPHGRIAIAIGAHAKFSVKEIELIDAFCASYDAIVICDHTSGYYGEYGVHTALIFGQKCRTDLLQFDLVISAGEISGDTMGLTRVRPNDVWRISEDGQFRNRFNNTGKVFEMSLGDFCKEYILEGVQSDSSIKRFRQAYSDIYAQIPELPFSNIWIAKQLSRGIPQGAAISFGILNSLRSWNLFDLPKGVDGMCNVGGFGIDGTLSTAIGRSIANPNRLTYCVLGDLAFFYDMNSLGNRHIGKNLRILLINNGIGDEFRIYDNPQAYMGEEVRPYIAAEGHYGHQSTTLVKDYVAALGFKYLTASTKEEFNLCVGEFLNAELNQSVVFEVMTRPEDDTEALDIIKHIVKSPKVPVSKKKIIKDKIKTIVGQQKIDAVKTLFK